MSFYADQHTARLSIRRGEIVSVDDAGEHQTVTGLGYAGETIKNAHRVQAFGHSSRPPAESHGLFLLVNGRPDQAIFLGAENPGSRPRSIGDGENVLYNHHGDIIGIYKKKIRVVTETVEIVCSQIVKIDAPTIELDGFVKINGNVVQQGGITSSGVHKAAGHT